ncbi:hypothetical protein VP1G_04351 [Cytospora mali]|uniref:HNH nuclease domain-containing protein n=1 Tax=Cytospora mali TaxID=578113 RepID=A0A194UZH9_CYTMA|nr:hypothetical protein VP1G_04351 [Valsa mali var. pyri (nom. inval.)]
MIARPPALSPATLAALVSAGSPVSLLHPLPKRGRDGLESRIRIRHPGYEDPHDILLVFRCVDPLPSDPGRDDNKARRAEQSEINTGVHHATVLRACAIVVGNAFDRASLSRDRQGQYPALYTVSLDGILEPGDYWLQVSSPSGSYPASTSPSPYPVVASFSDWRFPHRPLPWEWLCPHRPPAHQLPSISQPQGIADKIRQQQPAVRPCCISGHRGATESAHLVPQTMTEWFRSNMMGQYTRTSVGDIHDEANRIPLRADLNFLLDNPQIVFVPKPTTLAPCTSAATTTCFGRPEYALAVHVLDPKEFETVALYHNLSLQAYSDDQNIREYQDARRFLYARFAHSIFYLLQPFLQAANRFVLVAEDSNESNKPTSRSKPLEARWMSPKEMIDREMQRKQARSQSSPLKRRASQRDDGSDDLDEPAHKNGRRSLTRPWEKRDCATGHVELENDVSRWYDESLAPDSGMADELQNEVSRWYDENLAPRLAMGDGDIDGGREDSQQGRSRRRREDKPRPPPPPPPPFSIESCKSLPSSAAPMSRYPGTSSHTDGGNEQAGAEKLPARSVFLQHRLILPSSSNPSSVP